jgi:tetratricopeptide (TPR) repeat protein
MSPRARRLLPILIAIAAVLPFLPALSGAFLRWDDDILLVNNRLWRGFSPAHLRWMFTTAFDGPYQPLAWLSYAFDFTVWGLSPAAFHATSLVLHGASAGLFFLVLSELMERGAPAASARERAGAAAFGALVWAAHPLRVESVAWLSERRDVLCAFFSLLTVLFYLRAPEKRGRVLAAFAAALLSKASAIALPFTLLIFDVWPLGRWKRAPLAVVFEKIPLLIAALAIAAVGIVGQSGAAGLHPAGAGLRATLALHAPGFYLLKTLWPARLSPFYPVPSGFGPLSTSVLSAAAVAALAVAAAWAWRRRFPAIGAALAHYVVSLAPMLGLVRLGDQLAADRYTLVASLGPAALAGAALLVARRRAPRASALVAAAVMAALYAGTWAQARIWRSDVALWTQAVALDGESILARRNLAGALRRAGRDAEAEPHEEAAARLDPSQAEPQVNMASRALARGRFAEAEAYARRAVADDPALAAAHYNLGCALQSLGRNGEAIAEYRRAAALDPNDSRAPNNLGLALLNGGNPAAAAKELERAVRAAPGWAVARYNLGNALTALGRHAEAESSYAEAVRLDPSLAQAWVNGGNALARLGRFDEAARRYERALALNPRDADARRNLAAVRGARR